MIICYFGIYNPEYSRNRIMINGLRQNGVQVIECRSDKRGIAKYFELIRKHWRIRGRYDSIVVGFPGYQAMILAKCLTKKKIIFDVFTSLYDSMVCDRRIARKHSLGAGYYWFLDWLSCRLADKILLDTNEHIKYFMQTFKIKKEKFCRVFVGSDDEIIKFAEQKKKENIFLVHFHGSSIPLQGVEHIIKAAKLLEKESIIFNIIGSKIKQKYQDSGLSNVNLINNVPYEKLGEYISMANASLGIFGSTEKAKRVIPNKAYEALAAGRPIITGETPAAKELFTDGKNILFCKMGDARDLADKILQLKRNNKLREMISRNGYNLFLNNLTPRHIGKLLITVL